MRGDYAPRVKIFRSAAVLCLWICAAAADEDTVFDFQALKALAQQRAAAPYQPPDTRLPKTLQKLSYDELRDIRFDPKAAVWRRERLPFQLQFFHRGGLQSGRIAVHAVKGARVDPVPFSKTFFDYGRTRIPGGLSDDLGFSGFRIHYPLNRPDYLDEVLVFQGASYFRALGKNQRYGASARGLAVNMVGDVPEEFPQFTEFWVEEPDSDADRLRIYALLDSPALAGAYELALLPGPATVMEIKAALFARRTVERAGLAPLTTMFWFGENSHLHYDDFRPEVHDSDGMLIHTEADEWLWRPLVNDGRLRYSFFEAGRVKGFGLIQRDRQFASYEDLEACYHLRPSIWVEPLDGWGDGELQLLEIPTASEYADNVSAAWKPAAPLQPGAPFEFSYRLHWFMDDARFPLARTVSTRTGSVPGHPGARKFVLDFNHLENDEPLDADIAATNGRVLNRVLQRNEFNGTWRVFFDVEPLFPGRPVEMRCVLRSGGQPRSETWTCNWMP